MVNIYILKLEQNKYYVGKTNHINIRLKDHFIGNGSAWTKKYKPMEVIQVIKHCDVYDEDKYTLQYMKMKGIYNVRGGSFTQFTFDTNTVAVLRNMIRGYNDCCFKCGKRGHFTSECPLNKNYTSGQSESESESDTSEPWNDFFHSDTSGQSESESESESENECYKKRKKYTIRTKRTKRTKYTCYRCGRSGHFANQCYASKHVKGYLIKK